MNEKEYIKIEKKIQKQVKVFFIFGFITLLFVISDFFKLFNGVDLYYFFLAFCGFIVLFFFNNKAFKSKSMKELY